MDMNIVRSLIAALVLAGCGTAQAVHVDAPPAKLRPLTACPAGATVVVVGDSITALAADELNTRLALATYKPQINASGGRTIDQGVQPVLGYTYPTSAHRCWVIALGTNDVGQNLSRASIDLAMKDVLSRLPIGDDFWWVRVAIPGGDTVNNMIPTPVVTMIDWQPRPSDLYDGTHPNAKGISGWVSAVLLELTRAPV